MKHTPDKQSQLRQARSAEPERRDAAEQPARRMELRPGSRLFLQRYAGNDRVQATGGEPGGLRINQPGDAYEQEAERVAKQIVGGAPAAPKRPTTQTPATIAPPLQRAEDGQTALPSQQPIQAAPGPDPIAQMNGLLAVATNTNRPSGYCYRAVKRYIRQSGGYGNIVDIDSDSRFAEYRAYALQFAAAVSAKGADQLGIEEIIGNPLHAEPGTILVLNGREDVHINADYGDISVVGGWQGSNRVCYNDGRMILPGRAADWDPGGRYADLVVAMYRPLPQAAGAARVSTGKPASTGGALSPGLQREANGPGTTTAPAIVHDVLRSPGQPLDAATRAFMEPRFGQDFSQVRVHTDARAAESARAVSALAYTVGHNVVFGAGQYAPATNEGRRLMAHELTHVVQQRNVQQNPSILNIDAGSEQETDGIAANMIENSVASSERSTYSPTVLSRQEDKTCQDDYSKARDHINEYFDLMERMVDDITDWYQIAINNFRDLTTLPANTLPANLVYQVIRTALGVLPLPAYILKPLERSVAYLYSLYTTPTKAPYLLPVSCEE